MVQRNRSNTITIPAVESAVDAYAGRILRLNSPPEACFDPSLAQYITSRLRCAIGNDYGAELDSVEDLDSLVELLEEHCMMEFEAAKNALAMIFKSVKTGVVDDVYGGVRTMRRSRGISAGNEDEAIRLLAQMLRKNSISIESTATAEEQHEILPDNTLNFTENSEFDEDKISTDLNGNNNIHGDSNNFAMTPLKPTTLIPADLLGVLNDPSTPAPAKPLFPDTPIENKTESNDDMKTPKIKNIGGKIDQEEQSRSRTSSTVSIKIPNEKSSKDKKKDIALDLAATLFKPSRSRSNSIRTHERSPNVRPMQAPTNGFGSLQLNSPENQYLTESTVHILLSMNPSLSEAAAREATLVSKNDVNVAQYLLEKAMSAPPICRHMLNNACYRSDCQFSHDVEGHTCLFWLKGRCGKGDACRFLHGFSEDLLEGMVDLDKFKCNPCYPAVGTSLPKNVPITTENLVEHNMMRRSSSFSSSSHRDSMNSVTAAGAFGGGAYSLPIPQSLMPSPPMPTNMGRPLDLASSFQQYQNSTATPNKQDQRYSPNISSSITPDQKAKNIPPIIPVSVPLQTPRQPRTSSFASIASQGYSKKKSFQAVVNEQQERNTSSFLPSTTMMSPTFSQPSPKFARIPLDLWTPDYSRDSSMFHITDPVERYREVTQSNPHNREDVIDLHFQSLKTFPLVLNEVLDEKLKNNNGEVWIVTGSGHHVNRKSHQKTGGVLESAVYKWLVNQGYNILKGRDKNGHSGAVLVKEKI